MNENVIEFLRNADMATVTLCQTRFVTKVKKLAEQYPDECQILAENPDGSILAHIPVKWIKISRRAKQSRDYTDEEKRAFAEKLRGARWKGQKTDGSGAEDN